MVCDRDKSGPVHMIKSCGFDETSHQVRRGDVLLWTNFIYEGRSINSRTTSLI